MGDLGVSIAGQPLDHRLYHFALAYSAWEHAEPVLGGESFTALAVGLQNALWALGGVPAEHRSDSLSAAFRNLDDDARADQTRRYERVVRPLQDDADPQQHPGWRTRTAPSRASTATSSAASVRPCCSAAPRISPVSTPIVPGSPTSSAAATPRRTKMVQLECVALRPLPPARTTDYDEATVFVTSSSGFVLRKVFYTVPSRLIGFRLRVRLYDDRLECFVGQSPALILRRGRSHGEGRHGHVVDYRHIIHSLRCKPMALLNLGLPGRAVPPPGLPAGVGRRCWRPAIRERRARRWCRSSHSPMSAAARPNSRPRSPSRCSAQGRPARRAAWRSTSRRCGLVSRRQPEGCRKSWSPSLRSPTTTPSSRPWVAWHERQHQRHDQGGHRAAAAVAP